MHGITVDGQFPKTKKLVKEALAADPHRVRVIATSLNSYEYNGPVDLMPKDQDATCAGPDFQKDRRWCLTIKWAGDKLVCG